jgi:hypothetical protein
MSGAECGRHSLDAARVAPDKAGTAPACHAGSIKRRCGVNRDDPNRYPHRYNRDANKNFIAHLLERLDELERQTDPIAGSESAKQKDDAAYEALTIAGELVQSVAGWALDHQAGLALNHLQFVPFHPANVRDHPEYLKKRSNVDDHRHEREGGELRLVGPDNLDPMVARKWLVNLLRANPGGFSPLLTETTTAALDALDSNDVHPMLRPTPNDRKVNLKELKIQLNALAFVEYRVMHGTLKSRALEDVANLLGVSAFTIRSWEQRLKTEFGDLEVARTLSFARIAASNEINVQRRNFAGDAADDKARPGYHEGKYGPQALNRLAAEYRKALRQ